MPASRPIRTTNASRQGLWYVLGMAAKERRKRPADWSAKLTRSLTLKDGDKLVTLADARRVVLAHLTTVVEDTALTPAMRLLLAATTCSFADRNAAADQVAILLSARAVY
jgi:hypothetical protein